MPNHTELDFLLDEYIDSTDLPFALLINGAWGIGKTWYIEKYIERYKSKNPESFSCYVSLFGAKSSDDLHMKVAFAVAHQNLIKENQWKFFPGIVANLDKFGEYSELYKKFKLIAGKNVLNIFSGKKILFVFDDVERCSIEQLELLGSISEYIDKRNSRVILICNEEKIGEFYNSEEKKYEIAKYRLIKEKIVGQSFTIEPSIDSAFTSFIERILSKQDLHLIKIFTKNKDTIIQILEEGQPLNLRNLIKLIFEFKRLYSSFTPRMKEDVYFTEKILITCCSYIKKICDGAEIRINGTLAYTKTSSEENVIAEVPTLEYVDRLSLGTFWGEFFGSGIISERLNTHYHSLNDEPGTTYRIWNFIDLDDNELKYLLAKLFGEIASFTIVDPGTILHSFGILLSLSEKGIIPETAGRIEDIATHYIENIDIDFSGFDTDDLILSGYLDSYKGLSFWSNDSQEFKNIKKLVIDRFIKRREISGKEKLFTLLMAISNQLYSSSDLYKTYQSDGDVRKMWLNIATPAEIIASLKSTNQKIRRIVAHELEEIIKDQIRLNREWEGSMKLASWIENYLDLLEDWRNGIPPDTITRVNLNYIINTIETIYNEKYSCC